MPRGSHTPPFPADAGMKLRKMSSGGKNQQKPLRNALAPGFPRRRSALGKYQSDASANKEEDYLSCDLLLWTCRRAGEARRTVQPGLPADSQAPRSRPCRWSHRGPPRPAVKRGGPKRASPDPHLWLPKAPRPPHRTDPAPRRRVRPPLPGGGSPGT